MKAKLKILHLEDDPDYADLVRSLLQSEGFEVELTLAASGEEFEAALVRERFDIILADYLLPTYNGIQALQAARFRAPETPFLLVSGTMGEQAAIDSLQNGATDYVLKHWPERLVPAIRRAVKEAEERSQRKRAETELIRLSKLGQSLSSASSPAEAARIICAVADEVFAWEAFKLDLYCAQSEKVSPMLCVETDQAGRRYEVALEGESLPPSKLAKQVVARGAELIVDAATTEARDKNTVQAAPSPVPSSQMIAPVRNGTKVIGIVSVRSKAGKIYARQDLTTLQTLADHCGGALERIRAEQALRESEQQFRDLFAGSPDAVFVEDFQGTVLDVNPAACQLHGVKREELVGRNVADLVPPDARKDVKRDFGELVEGRLRQVEGFSWTADGRAIPVEVRANRVGYGGKRAVLLHVRDISQRKQLEEQLRQSQKMEAIGQLAGGVAHDFNNILTIIQGHASLLQTGEQLGPLGARSAQQIVQAAERAASLTRQLLAFSRRQIIQPRRLDMNEVVINMTKLLGRILGEDVALQLNYSPQPAPVNADASMMEQVLLNLAVNSRDAMPAGGQLTIKIAVVDLDQHCLVQHPEARPGRFVCLSAIDTGCGIPPENLRRIFEPFFTTKEVGKGTGLGLATVYGVVKQHQGWIEVESQPGQGARFDVYLPCCPQAAEPAAETTAEPPIRGGTETILIVEDDKPVRDLVCGVLAAHGYRILQAESGPQALEVWESSKDKVDLVLTDLVMPDRMNGRELAERLWSERPKLRVIFTSGYSSDVVGKDFVLQHGLNYIQKPYNPKKLAAAVRESLDGVN